MSDPIPVKDAARIVGVHESTLRRWIKEGAPIAIRGSRGRGRCALVHPSEILAWRKGRDDLRTASCAREPYAEPDVRVLMAAHELPELMAVAVHEVFRLVEGPHKRDLGGPLAGAWYACTTMALDRLREDCPAVPELTTIPEKIAYLQQIK